MVDSLLGFMEAWPRNEGYYFQSPRYGRKTTIGLRMYLSKDIKK
jgi:hypothetical protein